MSGKNNNSGTTLQQSLMVQLGNRDEYIAQLEQRIADLETSMEMVEKQLDASTKISAILNLIRNSFVHSSKMPDYKGENSDHDKRYLRIDTFVKSIITSSVILDYIVLKPIAAAPVHTPTATELFILSTDPTTIRAQKDSGTTMIAEGAL